MTLQALLRPFAQAFALWFLLAGPIWAQVAAPGQAVAVPRYDGGITVVVGWQDNSNNEDNFQIERREQGGSFANIGSVGPNIVQFEDTSATADKFWEYRVRARSAAAGNSTWSAVTAATSPRQVWLMDDGSHNVLNNYGMPLVSAANAANFYFHNGVDLSGGDVIVDIARGGTVTNISRSTNGQLNINLDYGSAGTYNDVYSHMIIDPALAVGDVLQPGDSIGTVSSSWFNRDFVAHHVHWGSGQSNLIPYTAAADRDPNNQAPLVADANDDGEDFILVRANNNDHTNALDTAWGGVDFLVDAYDDMTPGNTLKANPHAVGYWIDGSRAGGDNVQSAGTPYKLIEFDYALVGPSAPGATENAVMYWTLPADLEGINTWQSYFTWIPTNAADTDGAPANAVAAEFWKTDARAGTGTKANGSDANTARDIAEARFPDGEYLARIVLEDHVNASDTARALVVDNFRPYVKRLRVFSGASLIYSAEWSLDPDTGALSIPDFDTASAFPAARNRDLRIEIVFSEPMETASIVSVSPLGTVPTLTSDQPERQRTVWSGVISHLDIDDSGGDDGQHAISIAGTDLGGTTLLQVANRNQRPANSNIRDGMGNFTAASGQDSIHGFEIAPLSGELAMKVIFMNDDAMPPATPDIDAKALEIAQALNDYYGEVAYDEITFTASAVGWHGLDQAASWYFTHPRTPLIDLVQEAITAAEDGGEDLSGTDFVLVVTDETSARPAWSTNGGWPYDTDDGMRPLASGVLNLATGDPEISNLAGRMVGLVDLFAYPEVTPSRAFVGPWSHMSEKTIEPHVTAWEKWRAGWIDESGSTTGKTIQRISKPPVSTPIANQTVTLQAMDDGADGLKAVAIELADGLYYMAEFRRLAGLDAALPEAGVLISKANDFVAQGEGPLIVQESPVTSGDLADAPFTTASARDTFTDAGSGVAIEVTEVNAGDAEISIDYAVPPFENDVYVTDHDNRWQTVDIWVDAPDLSGNFEANPRDVATAEERPVVGEVNKVIGRVRNSGAADATNFEVELEILEPWGTGGTWNSLKVDTVPLLQGSVANPNADYLIVADWIPTADVHTCVRLRVRTVANDINPENNFTQENIHQFTTTSGSPFEPVISRFQVHNPFTEALPFFFKLDGVPRGWNYMINPERPVIPAGGAVEAQVILQPADDSPHCSEEQVTLTAWAPRIDTLKQVGGVTLAVGLKNPLNVQHKSWSDCDCNCSREDRRQCRIYTQGCTSPASPNTSLTVHYMAPDGTTQERVVQTDAQGCFADIIQGDVLGPWQTTVDIAETQCVEGARSGPLTLVVDTPDVPEPPREACKKLAERLSVLNDKLESAIAQRELETVKILIDEIMGILERNEECGDLADVLVELYAALAEAVFAEKLEEAFELLLKINNLLSE